MPGRVRPAGCRLCTLNTLALDLTARGRSQGEGRRPPGLPGNQMKVETRFGGQSRARTGSPLRRNAPSWEGESRTRRGLTGASATIWPTWLEGPQPVRQRQSSRRLCSRSRVALAPMDTALQSLFSLGVGVSAVVKVKSGHSEQMGAPTLCPSPCNPAKLP